MFSSSIPSLSYVDVCSGLGLLCSFVKTSLASRAIDGLSNHETRQGVIEALLAYLDTDTIL